MSKNDLSVLMKEFNDGDEASKRSKSLFERHPTIALGTVGGTLLLMNQVRQFTRRGDMRVSDYLIHTRMYVQGFFVICMTIGIGYEVGKFYRNKWFNSSDETSKTVTENVPK